MNRMLSFALGGPSSTLALLPRAAQPEFCCVTMWTSAEMSYRCKDMLQGCPLATCSTACCVFQLPSKQVWGCWQKVIDWSQEVDDMRWLHISQALPLDVPVNNALPYCGCTLLWLTHSSSNLFLFLHSPQLPTHHHSMTSFTSSWALRHFLPAKPLQSCCPAPTALFIWSLLSTSSTPSATFHFFPESTFGWAALTGGSLESRIILSILAFASLNSSTIDVVGIVRVDVEM